MGTEPANDETGRAWARAVLVVCGVLAVVLAALMVASVSTGGLAGSPIEQALPGEAFPEQEIGGNDIDAATGESGGFGALNPGDETGVGCETGFDNETYGSEDTSVHFTVESSQPSYWRTGTYDQYTGAGWEATHDPAPYDGDLSHDGIDGEEVAYEVTLEQPAAALPTVWRPDSVEGVEDLHVTDDGAIGVGEPLDAGTTFSGVSHLPEADSDLLHTSDQSYPSDIESQYTQLPADTPERVAEFTDELTADADNPYEKATIVEQWLRTEKEYSLEASAQSDHIADKFIFEMEAGYCQYFATAMTTMLRTQDIPTRYTVGYSTGTLVDENTYEVRGMNAHAWVEVYFEDVGWVPFEPTAASDRLDSEQDAIDEDGLSDEAEFDDEMTRPGETVGPDGVDEPESVEEAREQLEEGDYSVPEEFPQDGSLPDDFPNDGDDPTPPDDDPGNDIDPPDNGEEPPADDPTDGDSDGTTETGYTVSFNQSTLVPGTAVELTVMNGSDPAEFKQVSFNDEPIGMTGTDGTVEGTVPYADELEIGIEHAEFDSPDLTEDNLTWYGSTEKAGTSQLAAGSGTAVGGQKLFAGSGSHTGKIHETRAEDGGTYPIETNASVTVSGDIHPGNSVTVIALINETPVSNAEVRIDDESVGETGTDGQAEVTVPEAAGNHSLSIERGPVTGNTTISVPELEISVEANHPISLPLGSVTVEATYDNESVAGAAIERDGEEIATTGPDGTASVGLPFSSSTTLAVTQNDIRAESTVDGLLRNLALVLSVAIGVVGGIALLFYRSKYGPRTILQSIARLPGRIVAFSIAVLVRISTNGDEYLRKVVAGLRSAMQQLLGVLQGTVEPSELISQIRAWLVMQGEAVRRVLGRGATDAGAIGDDLPPDSQTRVREAWQRFLTYVSVGGKSTRTPGELATYAIERDNLPPESVITLCETFRAVEYGHRPATKRVERVEQALEQIERRDEQSPEQSGGVD